MFRSSRILILFLCAALCGDLRAQEPPSGADVAAAMEKTLIAAIARSEKSVVAIARVRKEQPGETFQLEFRPDPFGRRPTPLTPPQPTDPDFIPNEYGTGVIVDRAGLILTAYHVLAEESDYYVTTADHKTYKAVIKAGDPRSDLAVLAIDAVDLTPISLGNAAELRKGQIVISLGNPYAIARDGQVSAAWGIVANLARKAPAKPTESDPTGRPTLHHYGTLIQTDAKLNLGTSGGPLLNLKGEMVGLCVALAATPGYEAAGGYAIPVDPTFRRALDMLKQGREVEYGFLGIQPMNLQPREILAGLHGMRVGQVLPGTPAARYGLKAGDIVTDVDETPIHDADGLVLNVGKLPAAAVTRLAILRGGSPRTIQVTLSKYAVHGKKIVTVTDPAWRGLRVDYPTAVVRRRGPFPRRHVVCRRRGDCRRVGRGFAGMGGGIAPRDADYARRRRGGPHAEGVRRRSGSQPRRGPTSPDRRGEELASHGAADSALIPRAAALLLRRGWACPKHDNEASIYLQEVDLAAPARPARGHCVLAVLPRTSTGEEFDVCADAGLLSASPIRLRRYIWALTVFWTVAIGIVLTWELLDERNQAFEVARSEASGIWKKEYAVYRWAVTRGKVYVPNTEANRPDKNLASAAERDVTTPAGQKLTLVSPPTIMRQVFALSASSSAIRGRITSLNPVRPQNAPDAWERSALESLRRARTKSARSSRSTVGAICG